MDRREALSTLGATTLVPLLSRLEARPRSAAAQAPPMRALSPAQAAFVTALADTLIPATDTPGALDIEAPAFVDLLLAEWYSAEERRQLLAGIDALDARAATAQGKPLAELDPAGRSAFLAAIDNLTGPQPAISTPEGAYARIKSAIVTAYVTSKPVAELLRTTPIIPGRFDGCIPVGG